MEVARIGIIARNVTIGGNMTDFILTGIYFLSCLFMFLGYRSREKSLVEFYQRQEKRHERKVDIFLGVIDKANKELGFYRANGPLTADQQKALEAFKEEVNEARREATRTGI